MIVHDRSHWTHLKMPNVTVSVLPKAGPKSAVFMVHSLIDDGRGRKRLVLKDPEFLILETEYLMEPQRMIPPSLGDHELIYTGRFAMHVPFLHKALADFYGCGHVEQVGHEVLQPGDFVVFQKSSRAGIFKLVESIRVMTDKKKKHYTIDHAL